MPFLCQWRKREAAVDRGNTVSRSKSEDTWPQHEPEEACCVFPGYRGEVMPSYVKQDEDIEE